MEKVFDLRLRDLLHQRPPPRRIVSLVPSETHNLVALGCEDRIVGRTRYCEHAADAPIIGGTKDVDLEAVVALKADLVLANREENSRAQLEALMLRGVPVLITFPCTVREGVAHLAWLARLLDAVPRELIRAAYAAAQEPPPVAPVPAFVPIWMEPLMTVNGATYTSDALRLAGAENVFAARDRRYPLGADLGAAPASPAGERDTRYPRITLDELKSAAPALVLLPDEPHPFTREDAQMFRAALPEAKIAFCKGRDLMWPGAAAAEGIPRLRALIDSLR